MKFSDAGILLFSNWVLIACVLGEALPPDSIPIQCATICGPMVELSSICSGRSGKVKVASFQNKRRSTMGDKRDAIPQHIDQSTRMPKHQVDLAERDFTVIVPAPTSFPSTLLQQEGTIEPPKESRITHIRPTQILPTQEPPPPNPPAPPKASSTPPPPAAAPTPTQQKPPANKSTESNRGSPTQSTSDAQRGGATSTTSSGPHSSMDAMNDSDDDGDQGDDNTNGSGGTTPDKDQGRWTMNDGEKSCVCDNKSFNVPNVAALCSSCIATAKQLENGT